MLRIAELDGAMVMQRKKFRRISLSFRCGLTLFCSRRGLTPRSLNRSFCHYNNIPVLGSKLRRKSGTSSLFIKSPPATKLRGVNRREIQANIFCTALKTEDIGQAGVCSRWRTKCAVPASFSKASHHLTPTEVS